MKKIFTLLFVAVLAIGAYAQRGQMAAGINLMAVPSLESGYKATNFGFGGKFQYTLTNNIRLEGDIDYLTKNKGLSQFDIIANAQYLFNVAPRFNMYPVVGIGYASINHKASINMGGEIFENSNSEGRFLFNAGIGFEYELTSNLVGSFEVKYQYVEDWQKLPISIGIAYRF
ncbi:MAG: porin family protein [Clostridium sp.]|nr:porin family protein [Clostridium sp.]